MRIISVSYRTTKIIRKIREENVWVRYLNEDTVKKVNKMGRMDALEKKGVVIWQFETDHHEYDFTVYLIADDRPYVEVFPPVVEKKIRKFFRTKNLKTLLEN
jgi:hypothetical protein